jgi:hypothetical protein
VGKERRGRDEPIDAVSSASKFLTWDRTTHAYSWNVRLVCLPINIDICSLRQSREEERKKGTMNVLLVKFPNGSGFLLFSLFCIATSPTRCSTCSPPCLPNLSK